jgi:uncharacterized membrane protein
MTIALFLHVMSDVIWIGGMFLAYVCVRPAAAEVLEPPQRLRLWTGIFRRFFPWVWGAVIAILGSGFFMLGQLGAVPAYIVAMAVIGVVMKRAVAAEDWKAGGAALNQIRILVGTNLALGIINIGVAILGEAL